MNASMTLRMIRNIDTNALLKPEMRMVVQDVYLRMLIMQKIAETLGYEAGCRKLSAIFT